MTKRKHYTTLCTYGLVLMSVVYAVVGFADGGKSAGQLVALTATLVLFSWLLSEALETFLEHHRHNNWRRHSTLVLGAFLLGIEIHLVHFGMAWMLSDLSEFYHYLASAGFSAMTLLAKATFGFHYEEEPEVSEEVIETSKETPIAEAHAADLGMEQFITKVESIAGRR